MREDERGYLRGIAARLKKKIEMEDHERGATCLYTWCWIERKVRVLRLFRWWDYDSTLVPPSILFILCGLGLWDWSHYLRPQVFIWQSRMFDSKVDSSSHYQANLFFFFQLLQSKLKTSFKAFIKEKSLWLFSKWFGYLEVKVYSLNIVLYINWTIQKDTRYKIIKNWCRHQNASSLDKKDILESSIYLSILLKHKYTCKLTLKILIYLHFNVIEVINNLTLSLIIFS